MAYKTAHKVLKISTKYRLQFITLTSEVEHFVRESGIEEGIVVISSMHTTCSLVINENEKNLIGHQDLSYDNDLKRVMDRFASPDEEYHHNDICDEHNPKGKRDTHLCEPDEDGIIRECKNGHAHAQALLTQPSLTLVITKGHLEKGLWQEIMLVELDHDRMRTVSLHVQGESSKSP